MEIQFAPNQLELLKLVNPHASEGEYKRAMFQVVKFDGWKLHGCCAGFAGCPKPQYENQYPCFYESDIAAWNEGYEIGKELRTCGK